MIAAANVRFMWDTVINPRIGTDYNWGGSFDPGNDHIGTDCSGAVSAVIEALINGAGMRWERQFWTGTFAGITPGGIGPYGLICIATPDGAPADAAAIVAIRQGPTPESSHMMVQVGGINIEDGDGLVVGEGAADIHDRQFNQWFYLPGSGESLADQYARQIIVEGQRRTVTPRGIQIALATALVESNLVMYANASVPNSLLYTHQAVGSDHDSVGLFQQRCPLWGPAGTLMDPTASAGLFYDRLLELDYNGPNSPGSYGQAVQRSAFPDRYDERFDDAVALYRRLITALPMIDDGGFMSALTEKEQRDLYNEIMGRRPSRSPLRHLGEGPIGDESDVVFAIDGAAHLLVVYLLATLGQPAALQLLTEVAGADPTQYPDRAGDALIAQAILNKIQQVTAEPVVARHAAPAADPAAPTADPTTPTADPAAPAAAPTAAPAVPGNLSNDLDSLKGQIAYVRTVLDDFAN